MPLWTFWGTNILVKWTFNGGIEFRKVSLKYIHFCFKDDLLTPGISSLLRKHMDIRKLIVSSVCGQVTVRQESHSTVLEAIYMSQAKHFWFSNLMRLSLINHNNTELKVNTLFWNLSAVNAQQTPKTILKRNLCRFDNINLKFHSILLNYRFRIYFHPKSCPAHTNLNYFCSQNKSPEGNSKQGLILQNKSLKH